jgi:uncharacterized protein (TIGR00369 family)
MTLDDLLQLISDTYENDLPFNRVLGLKVDTLTETAVTLHFDMQPDLVGNFVHGILHGGVISAALDVAGGLVATAGIIRQVVDADPETAMARIARIGTIDLRIDYLRRGEGKRFTVTGSPIRTGRKVAVVRTDLKNESEVLIAAGTGTYMVG